MVENRRTPRKARSVQCSGISLRVSSGLQRVYRLSRPRCACLLLAFVPSSGEREHLGVRRVPFACICPGSTNMCMCGACLLFAFAVKRRA